MNNLLKTSVLALGLCLTTQAAVAAPRKAPARNGQQTEAFKWAPKSKADPAGWTVTRSVKGKQKVVTEAEIKLPESDSFGYLDLPDGRTWVVTFNENREVLQDYGTYQDYNIKGIDATVYDENYEAVGRINFDIPMPEGFEKCTQLQIGPAVTKKFFNLDDNYEVMLMANFKPTGEYGATPFTYVFSLRGADKNAELVTTKNGYYISAVNNAQDKWSENFFMEFFTGETYTDTQMIYSFEILSKATYGDPNGVSIGTFDVDMVYCMSDGENETMPVVMNSKGSEVYVAVAQYEKTFFVDPFDYMNEELNADNSYQIKLYKKGSWDNKLQEVGTTSIPCETPEGDYTMRTYCLGRFQGGEDVSFDFTADGQPAFVLSIADSDIYENNESFFRAYSLDGTLLKEFGKGSGGYTFLGDVEGYPQQLCFVEYAGETPVYAFYDYPSFEAGARIESTRNINGVDQQLSMTMDRAAGNGSYVYAFSTVQGDQDADGNIFHTVAWFDREGEYLRADSLMGGQMVNAIRPYVATNALTPYLFNTDDAQEYMILIQRADQEGSSKAHTELAVVNDRCETLLNYAFGQDDTGILVTLLNAESNPALWFSYTDFQTQKTQNEFVRLPLNKLEGEGTPEAPYLLKAAGDFQLIKNNLSASYKMAANVDFRGSVYPSLDATFTGEFDGAGFTIRNAKFNAPMFKTFGVYAAETKTSFKNVVIKNPIVESEAVIASNSYAAAFNNVHILGANVAGSAEEFGGLVKSAMGTDFLGCSFSGDVFLPEAGFGGIAFELINGSRVVASSVSGNIKAGSFVGGVASSLDGKSTILDSHVNASIEARNNIGGLVSTSARGLIARNFVEGDIVATEAATTWSEYAGGRTQTINVGGLIGTLETARGGYDDMGNPVEASTEIVVENNIVAIGTFTIPEGEGLEKTAHRVVGRSSVNDDPAYLGEEEGADGEWTIIWGDPAAPEACIRNNYAVDTDMFGDDVEDASTSTEGESVAAETLNKEWFTTLAFVFDGYSTEEPWLLAENNLPYLHFEKTVGANLEWRQTSVSATVGEPASVVLLMEGLDVEGLTISSSDEANCSAYPTEQLSETEYLCAVEVQKEGTYEITASHGTHSSLLLVTGKSGIKDAVVVKTIVTFDGQTVRAEGCKIQIVNLQGVSVASGADALSASSLPTGVYVAVATDANGARHTLKISVR